MAADNSTTCYAPRCDRKPRTRGLCHKHHHRLWKTGTIADRHRPTAEQRFWALVNRRGHDECWPWLGWTNASGHGQFAFNARKRYSAHVFAWMTRNGPLPSDKPQGLHKCDNPPCCNPEHVFPGTKQDNVKDRHAKRRDAIGDTHGMTKIPDSAVPVIIARAASGEWYKHIARDFGVATVTIASIVTGVRRQHCHVALPRRTQANRS